ncbi:two-component system, NarL family, response regulator DegU [Evansella caseinilytica]|uniref:Two-component system, NarL family, response regulator DegU n=1 Tax=Evansella caseinilytica TaxID=1503961 RepID=A0A1H3ULL0_9BACI|nr:LuxR C-terminal-related transcriptional regulator [Evansella caseinilytica]SDZ63237.1 two-component system, NarL family, response regulator DegU [Evansella caseinilytica]
MLMAARDSQFALNMNIQFVDSYYEIPVAMKEEVAHQIKVHASQISDTLPSMSMSPQKDWLFFVVDGYNKESLLKMKQELQQIILSQTYIIILNKNPLQKEMLEYLSLKVNGIVSLSFLMTYQSMVIRSIIEKGIFLEPQFHKTLILEIERKNSRDKPIKKLILNKEKVDAFLTKKEQDILQLLLEGKSNKNIAEILYFAPSTIGTIISCLLKKIDANDRTDAMVKAIRNGWVDAVR